MTYSKSQTRPSLQSSDRYYVYAVRYAIARNVPREILSQDGQGGYADIAMMFWLIIGRGRVILFDCGFYRDTFRHHFTFEQYLRPDAAIGSSPVAPSDITDIVISHMHWDHVGGVALFPKATVWIRNEEYQYYAEGCNRPEGCHDGIDSEDIKELSFREANGTVRRISGYGVEIMEGLRMYTGGRHTFASQFMSIDSSPPLVLASDECYFYSNLENRSASTTFSPMDQAANIANHLRMLELVSRIDDIVPGHDLKVFEKFKTIGNIAILR